MNFMLYQWGRDDNQLTAMSILIIPQLGKKVIICRWSMDTWSEKKKQNKLGLIIHYVS